MARPRHKHVLEKVGASRPRRVLRVGLPALAILAVGSATVAVALPDQPAAQSASAVSVPAPQVEPSPVPVRVAPISRSETRVKLEAKPVVKGHLFATTPLNVRAKPTADSRRVASLEWAEKIAVSGERQGEWVEVVIDELGYWVHSDFLAKKKPEPEPEPEPEAEVAEEESAPAPTGVSSAACADSSVEAGLVPNAVAVYRAVCGTFPSITSYGGVRAGDSGEHGTGNALDIMISGDPGWEVAEYVRANAGELGVSEVIYAQKIWTVERSSEGWRYMEDRGSTTANHYDHVHVSVY
ncbi:MAG TPA: SH3 domain-containing protein [Nocardioidaceae bacterium]